MNTAHPKKSSVTTLYKHIIRKLVMFMWLWEIGMLHREEIWTETILKKEAFHKKV